MKMPPKPFVSAVGAGGSHVNWEIYSWAELSNLVAHQGNTTQRLPRLQTRPCIYWFAIWTWLQTVWAGKQRKRTAEPWQWPLCEPELGSTLFPPHNFNSSSKYACTVVHPSIKSNTTFLCFVHPTCLENTFLLYTFDTTVSESTVIIPEVINTNYTKAVLWNMVLQHCRSCCFLKATFLKGILQT